MRETKFRGKSVKTGNWVTGYLFPRGMLEDPDYLSPLWIASGFENECTPVDEKTIGQYTGLPDKNGKEIYEGDIVRVGTFREEDGEESWWMDDSVHRVEWCGEDDYPAFDLHPSLDTDCNGLACIAVGEQQAEVIGNIHENLDLLDKA